MSIWSQTLKLHTHTLNVIPNALAVAHPAAIHNPCAARSCLVQLGASCAAELSVGINDVAALALRSMIHKYTAEAQNMGSSAATYQFVDLGACAASRNCLCAGGSDPARVAGADAVGTLAVAAAGGGVGAEVARRAVIRQRRLDAVLAQISRDHSCLVAALHSARANATASARGAAHPG